MRGYRSERTESGEWLWVLVKKETAKAWLMYDGEKDNWIPKSQILDEEDTLGIGVVTKVELPMWIIDEKELNTGNTSDDVQQQKLELREPGLKVTEDKPL